MKKVILILMIQFLANSLLVARYIEVGNPNSSTNASNVPTNGNFDYSWSKFLVQSEAFGNEINIEGVQFKVSNNPTNYVMHNQQLYIRTTTDDFITNQYPDPQNNDYRLVFDGTITWDGYGWQGLEFINEFSYNGIDNLEFVWVNNDGSSSPGFPVFKYTNTGSTYTTYSNNNNSFPTDVGSSQSYRPNLRILYNIENEPNLPIIISPYNNSIDQPLTGRLAWICSANTDGVDLYLSNDIASVINNNEEAKVIDNQFVEEYNYSFLNAETYYWKVVARNEVSGITMSSQIVSFTAIGGQISIPLYYNFDDIPLDNLPSGWSNINTSNNEHASVYLRAGAGIESSNALALYNGPDSSCTLMAITPEIYGSNARMVFMARTSSSFEDNAIICGTISDVTDPETFVETQTIPIDDDWTEYQVELTEGANHYAFKHNMVSGYRSLRIDNLLIEEIPQLPAVTDLTVTVECENTALLNWTAPISDEYTFIEYKVFRNGTELTSITDTTYRDLDLSNGSYTYTVKTIYAEGDSEDSNTVSINIDYTNLEDLVIPSSQIKLNYPNPFNPETTINYSLKNTGKVSINVYNIRGQRIRTLVNSEQNAGSHTIIWHGKNDYGNLVTSGIYFCRMKSGKYTSTIKMILMK